MSEILSVEGQLVGIPVEKYTGVSGIVVDPVNKTIRADETVLWETPVSSATADDVTLSESRLNFDYIRILTTDDNYNTFDFVMRSDVTTVRGTGGYYSGSSWIGFRVNEVVATNETTLSVSTTPQISFTSSGAFREFNTGKYSKILKVVGINRKA